MAAKALHNTTGLNLIKAIEKNQIMGLVMKTLIIHHLEEMWQDGYLKKGKDVYSLCREAVEYITSTNYNKVILTRFEGPPAFDDVHYETGLSQVVDEIYEYGYGWDGEMVLDDEFGADDYVEGGCHSEYVWLAPWMHELEGEIFICGAFDGECLEDLQIALNSLEIEFVRIPHLIC